MRTATLPSSTKTSSYRNELLKGSYAAIDIEYHKNNDNRAKSYTIFAASIVDNKGNVKTKHVSDFASYSVPEKALVEWIMHEILNYRLTIGWYSKGVESRDG